MSAKIVKGCLLITMGIIVYSVLEVVFYPIALIGTVILMVLVGLLAFSLN